MNINLFKLALDRLQPSDWNCFEKLSSAFLAADFSDIRTMANASGDGGRDSELYSPNGVPFIVFQYSVQKDWESKINQTVNRLSRTFPDVRIINYLSNLQIGAQADAIKKELSQKGYSLDVRDQNWFLERANSSNERQLAAEELIDRIARPYLAGEGVINKPSSPLSSQEAKAALVYLGLQWQDDISAKGLTKLSFEALVRAALRHSSAEARMSRVQIRDIIKGYLPSSDAQLIERHIDSALNRLSKRVIRHWQKEDEFCLSFDENQRMISRLADKEVEEAHFLNEIFHQSKLSMDEVKGNLLSVLQERIPRIIENLLLRRGETFVSAVLSGHIENTVLDTVSTSILDDLSKFPPADKTTVHLLPEKLEAIIRNLFTKPTEATQLYLHRLADSYTIFSFLRETPDVQKATKTLFSHGTIWLDTSVILPLFAEQLEDDELFRRLTRVVLAARQVGIELRVTPSVIHEIFAHMKHCVTCSEYTKPWQGRVPYLYSKYLELGKSRAEFAKWLLLFRGTERPEDDVAQFLYGDFGIQRQALVAEADSVDQDLKWAAERLWEQVHRERRKNKVGSGNDFTTIQLIKNDIESYLGVVALRQKEQVSELGYRNWFMTFDSTAWQIRDRLKGEFPDRTPPSPLLSADFLTASLTFGPQREALTRLQEQKLPVILDLEIDESMSQEILQVAYQVRKDNETLPEHVIRRNVRDAIDKARRGVMPQGFGPLYTEKSL